MGRSRRSTSVTDACSNHARTRTDVRAPSGSYSRTTTSPEPSSASLTASTYAVALDADERLDGGPLTAAEREVQRVPRLGGLRDPGAGHQRVPQHVPALVGLRVGEQRRAQQAEPDPRERAAAVARMTGDVVAVGRVVGQPDAVPAVAHVDPPVRAYLEPRRVPRGVLVGRPDDVTELGLVRRVVGVHVDVEGRLEHLLAFVPVDLGLDLEPVVDSRIRCLAEDSPKVWVTTTVSPSTVTSPCVRSVTVAR